MTSKENVAERSLDGRRFNAVANENGEVGQDTVFTYHEADGTIWAEYAGGTVLRGYLVGTRQGDEIELRYVHLNVEGETASGVCSTRIEFLDDGRAALHERWSWESRPGSGTSTVVELADS